MRDCNKYQEMLSCLTDGELSAEESAELYAHIDTCHECRKVYEAFAAISGALSENLAEPPEYFTESVMDKIALQNSARGGKRRGVFVRVAAIAACLAVILLGSSRLDLFGRRASDSSAADAPPLARYAALPPEAAAGAGETEWHNSGILDGAAGAAPGEGAVAEHGDMQIFATEGPAEDDIPEIGVSLFGMSAAQIYSVGDDVREDSNPEEELLLTITDEDSLYFLAELLSFSQYPDEKVPQSDPVFIVGVESGTGEISKLRVWVIDGRLWCGREGRDIPYIARGSLDDLLKLIYEA